MGQGKRAKILNPKQENAVLRHLETTRYPERDRVLFLLSIKAGLRAAEIAALTWAMVTDANGQIGDSISLENRATKGKKGGRDIPLHPELREALRALLEVRENSARPDWPVIHSERVKGLSGASVAVWFHRLYSDLGLEGCSSHSGRRTFVTRAAKKCIEAGGSLRDVQQLAGHSHLATTQRYIEGDSEAKRRLVSMI
jgi:integrase/recombinase XerD